MTSKLLHKPRNKPYIHSSKTNKNEKGIHMNWFLYFLAQEKVWDENSLAKGQYFTEGLELARLASSLLHATWAMLVLSLSAFGHKNKHPIRKPSQWGIQNQRFKPIPNCQHFPQAFWDPDCHPKIGELCGNLNTWSNACKWLAGLLQVSMSSIGPF